MKIGTRVRVKDTEFEQLNGMLGAVAGVDSRTVRTSEKRRRRKKTWYYVALQNHERAKDALSIMTLADPEHGLVWLSSDHVEPWHPQHDRHPSQRDPRIRETVVRLDEKGNAEIEVRNDHPPVKVWDTVVIPTVTPEKFQELLGRQADNV